MMNISCMHFYQPGAECFLVSSGNEKVFLVNRLPVAEQHNNNLQK